VPALYADQTCDPYVTVAGRVREKPRLAFVSWEWFDRMVPGCWRTEGDLKTALATAHCQNPSWSDCSTWTVDAGGCLQMNTLCGGMIPLAVVTPRPPQDGNPVPPKIDTDGRPHLVVDPCRTLTHISWFNWRHGGTIALDELEDDGLVIAFDHPVHRYKGHRRGSTRSRFSPSTARTAATGTPSSSRSLPTSRTRAAPSIGSTRSISTRATTAGESSARWCASR
jgi:hypothetical protein